MAGKPSLLINEMNSSSVITFGLLIVKSKTDKLEAITRRDLESPVLCFRLGVGGARREVEERLGVSPRNLLLWVHWKSSTGIWTPCPVGCRQPGGIYTEEREACV